MKITSLPKLALTSTLTLTLALGLIASADADIVYQDTFADGDIATNPDIGGGLSQFTASSGSFSETITTGSLVGDSSTNNMRAHAFSTNSFDLSGGFILEFTANTTNIGATSANRFGVGLAAEGANFQMIATQGRNFLGDRRAVTEAVGINFTTDHGSALLGLTYNDGLGDPNVDEPVTAVDITQTIAANTDLAVILTVAADGSYTYAINGATPSTGGDFGLDLTQNYHFSTYYQDNEGTSSIRDVTLTAIPEPSSIALLGLGGIALFLRRKK